MAGVAAGVAVAVLLAGGVLAVRRTATSGPAATTSTTGAGPSSPATTAGPPASTSASPELQAIERIREQVAAIRGLPWKAPLTARVVSADELARRVREYTLEDFQENQSDVAAVEAVLKLLKLIPQGTDYRRTIENLLAGGVLGFYDDETKELFVKDDGRAGLSPAARSTLVHELVHALTDQHFEFSVRIDQLDEEGRTEELAALLAVAEGDAELVRTLYTRRHMTAAERRAAAEGETADGTNPYAGVPTYLVRSLLFPYTSGLTFVDRRHSAGGFGAVDDLYRRPPLSTAQILHPERYGSEAPPPAPALPDVAAAAGCAAVDAGSIGEFDMTQVLDEQLAQPVAEVAAAGWSADSYRLVRCGQVPGLVDRWLAESPGDAGELVSALAQWAAGWSGSPGPPGPDGRFSGPAGAGRVTASGNRVDLVLAGDVATSERLIAAAGA